VASLSARTGGERTKVAGLRSSASDYENTRCSWDLARFESSARTTEFVVSPVRGRVSRSEEAVAPAFGGRVNAHSHAFPTLESGGHRVRQGLRCPALRAVSGGRSATSGPRRDPQASDERRVHLGRTAKPLRALCRTRTDDPFLTILGRGLHRVPGCPGSPINAGHFGLEGTSRTLGRDPATPQRFWIGVGWGQITVGGVARGMGELALAAQGAVGVGVRCRRAPPRRVGVRG
jgi:hypothetical protein